MKNIFKNCLRVLICSSSFLSFLAFAATEPGPVPRADTIGLIAQNVVSSFGNIGELMVATAYIGGFILVIASVFKFKQHKDNPTQIPMGTPVALLAIGAILIFLPSIIGPVGHTIFGQKYTVGGSTGTGFDTIDNTPAS